MTQTIESTATPVPHAQNLSPFARAIAIFVRPTQAWVGLREHAQWWFPMVVSILISVAGSAALHQRALVPMMMEQWEQQVADGTLPADRLDAMESFFTSPAGMATTIAQQAIFLPIMTLVIALLIWFGAGFVLGTSMKFRLALEVATWSGLVSIPAQLIAMSLAWMRQTFRGVHTGFGLLLPESDAPSKLLVALGVVLDAIGPLSLWYLAVAVIGAAELSGAPRKSVAWVLGGIYIAVTLFGAAMAAVFTPGS